MSNADAPETETATSVPQEEEDSKHPLNSDKTEEDSKQPPKTGSTENEARSPSEKEEAKEPEPKVEDFPKKPTNSTDATDPKIPTDFSGFIQEIKEGKDSGNEVYKKEGPEKALGLYLEIQEKINENMAQVNKERDYNREQCEEIINLNKLIQNNIAICYHKTNKIQECITIDLKIISHDPKYDKSYLRLFENYLKLEKTEQAIYFGNILLNFDEETKNKYKSTLPLIEAEIKKQQEKYEAIKRKERNAMIKSVAKYVLPLIVLIGGIFVYFKVIKKK